MEGTPRGGASRTGSSAREPGTNASVPASASTASATLSEKKELQENHWRSRPDAKRPRTAPPPAPPTNTPTAAPRSSGGKGAVITDYLVADTTIISASTITTSTRRRLLRPESAPVTSTSSLEFIVR